MTRGDDPSSTDDARDGADQTSVAADVRVVLRRWPWILGVLGVLIAALCAAGFAELTDQVYHRGPVVGLDRRLLDLVAPVRTELLVAIWSVLTWVGDGLVVFPVAVTVGLVLTHRTRSPAPLILLTCASAGISLAVELIKLVIARPRPPTGPLIGFEDGFGFPSGHSAHATAVYLMIALLVLPMLTSTWQRWLVAVLAVTLIATAMTSRVVLGVHAPTDVCAGLLLGTAWTVLLLSIHQLGAVARLWLHRLAHS